MPMARSPLQSTAVRFSAGHVGMIVPARRRRIARMMRLGALTLGLLLHGRADAADAMVTCLRARVWITRVARSGTARDTWITAACGAPTTTAVHVILRPRRRYQRMLGFGAALTGGAAWLIEHRQSPEQRRRLLTELFAHPPAGIGLDLLRVPIGSSDLSRRRYSLASQAPASAASAPHIDLAPIDDTTLPVLRQILAINPQLKIIASPWSAPAWMKTSGHMIGGELERGEERRFAEYLAGYVRAMRTQGVPIYALTLQNEPDFTPRNYPGMKMGARQRARIIARDLGPLLARAGGGTAILDWDDNWSHPDQPLRVLANPAAARYVLGVAWHCYRGNPSAQSLVHARYPDKLALLTECSDGLWAPEDHERLAGFIDQVFIGPLRNWASGIVLWGLALDRAHGPHLGGCSKCVGVVSIARDDGAVARTRDFYALAHFSRFVRPGAYRIGAEVSGSADIAAVAFADTARHTIAVVVTNRGADSSWVRIGLDARQLAFALPAGGAATVEIDTTHT